MGRRIVLLCAALLVARSASAGPIVTWEGSGLLTASTFAGYEFTGRVPDPGTAYSLTMSFDPTATSPTPLSAAGSGCNMVSVAGTLTLGGYDYDFNHGFGFTHAQLPGSNCSPGAHETQFLFPLSAPPDNPWWAFSAGMFMEAWYVDLLNPDGFSSTPPGNMGWQLRVNDLPIHVTGGLTNLRVTGDQENPIDPAPVPEPGTLTLLGLGLAEVIRRKRLSR
jgi:hypothetical protein